MHGWLSAAEELAAYEGIRLGDRDAFVALAAPLQPSLRRLARLYVDPATEVDTVVRRTWQVALGADAMFRWQTPLATWVAAIGASTGRSHAALRAAAPGPPPGHLAGDDPGPGPADWSDLPWSERWRGVGTRLDERLRTLPLEEREVLHGHDLERWPTRRTCDVFGLPEAVHDRLLVAARTRVHTELGRHIGADGHDDHRDEQLAAVTRWLGRQVDDRPEPLDPATLAVFQRWAAARSRGWRRLTRRGAAPPLSGRSAAPAGRRGGPGSASASGRPRPT